MSYSEEPVDLTPEMVWRIRRANTGHGWGVFPGKPDGEDIVHLTLWAYDLPEDKPFKGAMSPDEAEELANGMLEAVRRSREARN